jgi:hypothetical protein
MRKVLKEKIIERVKNRKTGMGRGEIRIIGWEEMSLYYVGKEEIRKSAMSEMRKLGGKNGDVCKELKKGRKKGKLRKEGIKKGWREIGIMKSKKKGKN